MTQKENELINDIEIFIDENIDLNTKREEIKILLKEYKRNIKQMNKIIRIGDKQQEIINNKKELLEDLSHKLSSYLSPQIYKMIFSGEKDVTLKSERKKLTIFFSDLVNFTQTTENLQPEALTLILNHYLDEMVTIALQYGATIDKYIGDAILIFFGDPETFGDKEDAMRCVSMAIDMRKKVEELAPMWKDMGLLQPFKLRMGVTTGYVTVGNFGSKHRMDYTIIGSHVNLASRLETNANPNTILISHETYSLIKDDIFCEKKDTIFVKGIPYPIPTYEVINFFSQVRHKDEINISNNNLTLYINKENIKSALTKEDIINELKKVINELADC
jgi:class 3 adenylate cyclase